MDLPGRHPGFFPYRRLREELLGLPAGHWIARCDALATVRGLRSACGAPIRFVPGGGGTGALDYEAAILRTGTVACRTSGSGGRHDLHNALVWLTFPQTKSTLNRLHLSTNAAPAAGRSRLRDRLTLLDESGLLWLSSCADLDRQLLDMDWSGLLVQNHERVRRLVLPIVVGHGLLDKLAAPYKSMTAHCLVCSGPWTAAAMQEGRAAVSMDGTDPVDAPDAVAMDATEAITAIDAGVAALLAASCVAGALPRLAPLPILGLPGWDPANVDRSYYGDTRVFRSPRARRA